MPSCRWSSLRCWWSCPSPYAEEGCGRGRRIEAACLGFQESGHKLALAQMHCRKGQVARNLARTAGFIHQAAEAKADLVCFPEMSITGYVEPRTHSNAVLHWDDPQLAPLFELSKRSPMTLVAGIAERNSTLKPFISQGVIRDRASCPTARRSRFWVSHLCRHR